jgi:hypothetical protein
MHTEATRFNGSARGMKAWLANGACAVSHDSPHTGDHFPKI